MVLDPVAVVDGWDCGLLGLCLLFRHVPGILFHRHLGLLAVAVAAADREEELVVVAREVAAIFERLVVVVVAEVVVVPGVETYRFEKTDLGDISCCEY